MPSWHSRARASTGRLRSRCGRAREAGEPRSRAATGIRWSPRTRHPTSNGDIRGASGRWCRRAAQSAHPWPRDRQGPRGRRRHRRRSSAVLPGERRRHAHCQATTRGSRRRRSSADALVRARPTASRYSTPRLPRPRIGSSPLRHCRIAVNIFDATHNRPLPVRIGKAHIPETHVKYAHFLAWSRCFRPAPLAPLLPTQVPPDSFSAADSGTCVYGMSGGGACQRR